MDRCFSHKGVEVLEAVKVLFDVRGFVFVLALDRNQVQTAIQDIYNSGGRKIVGSDYLKKLVQVKFDLPRMLVGQVGDYLNSLQRTSPGSFDDETGGAFKEIVPFLSKVRSEIKRFINQPRQQLVERAREAFRGRSP